MTTKLSPLLKWAGGKTWLAPLLREIYEPYRDRTWVEPFVGGMGATLGVMPERAILNDANPQLINLYQQVQSGKLTQDCINFENTREAFLINRQELNARHTLRGKYHLPYSHIDAALFLYLCRTCFNGLSRFNKKGEFNVNFGSYKNPKLVHDFAAYRQVFSQWQFTCGDFVRLAIAPNSFIYLDPPYDCQFTTYSSGGFSWTDQQLLIDWADTLDCPIVVSNAATDRVISLYENNGFELFFLDAPRRISCNGDRKPVKEVLAFKGVEISANVRSKLMQSVEVAA